MKQDMGREGGVMTIGSQSCMAVFTADSADDKNDGV